MDGYAKPDAVVLWTPEGARGLDSRSVRNGVGRLTLALRALGLERGERAAILSENRPEWLLADYAILAAGGVVVPVYPSLSHAQIEYILANSDAKVLFVSTPALLERLHEALPRLHALKHVVLMDASEGGAPGVLAFRDLMARGRELELREPDAFVRLGAAVEPGDLASLIYTSGTTGPPKGVMLTHRNFVTNVEAVARRFDFTPADRALSFLPLCHAFERVVDFYYLSRGVTIVHVGLEHLLEAFRAMRPTVIASVPRLFEKMRDRIEAALAAAPPFRRRLFAWARAAGVDARLAPVLTGRPASLSARLRCAAADALVLGKVRAALGGRLRIAISGGAGLPPGVFEYFVPLGVIIAEGYGLSETSPVVAVNDGHRPRPGSVGRPIDDCEVRIAADGEILVRGPNVMAGYFRDPEGTAAAMEGGWFHTGDIGVLDADGYLSITDRKKDLIITSGGKNVAPQLLESALRSTGIVAQAVVVGNGRKHVSALVVPDPDALRRLCERLGVAPDPVAAAIAHPAIEAAYRDAVRDAMRDFAPYEQVKRIALLPREFTIESGELTPTMKVRRRIVEERYRREIESMYGEEEATA